MGEYDRPDGVDPLVWLLAGQERDPHFRSRVQEGDILAALDAAVDTIESQRGTIEGYRFILRATIRDYHEQGDALRMLQERIERLAKEAERMKVVSLSPAEALDLRDALTMYPAEGMRIAYDPLGRAIKVKRRGRWSPSFGNEVDQA